MTFPEIVSAWLDLHEPTYNEANDAAVNLASEFEVAVSTVHRWGSGVANPHPLKKVQILKSVLEAVDWHQTYLDGGCHCDWCTGCAEIAAAIKVWNE